MMDATESAAFVPPDGGYGWIIVIATTLINICALPLGQCFGIIYENDFKKLEITASETSLLLHLHSAIYCSLGLLSSPLLKKYEFRRIAFLGTSLMSLGIFVTSFAQSYIGLICTFSVLVGLGQGIMLPATYLATNTYFKKRLTLAVSFSVTGVSISYIFMPQICNTLLNHFHSTKITVQILGAISLGAIACCFLLKPIKRTKTEPPSNEMLEPLNTNGVYQMTTRQVAQKTTLTKIQELFNLELLRNRRYVVVITGMSISFASELNIILMVSFILPELALFSRDDVALALSVQSVADIIGRLGVPLLGHCFNVSPKVMYAGSLVTSTVGRTIMAVFYSSRVTIFLCVSLLGLAKGTKAVYQSVLIPRYVPLEKLPAANGLNMFLTAALSLILGPIIGAIHDVTSSYVYTLHFASIISMTCVALWIVHFFIFEHNKTENPPTAATDTNSFGGGPL